MGGTRAHARSVWAAGCVRRGGAGKARARQAPGGGMQIQGQGAWAATATATARARVEDGPVVKNESAKSALRACVVVAKPNPNQTRAGKARTHTPAATRAWPLRIADRWRWLLPIADSLHRPRPRPRPSCAARSQEGNAAQPDVASIDRLSARSPLMRPLQAPASAIVTGFYLVSCLQGRYTPLHVATPVYLSCPPRRRYRH